MTRPSREFVYVNGSIYLTNEDITMVLKLSNADTAIAHKKRKLRKSDELWRLATEMSMTTSLQMKYNIAPKRNAKPNWNVHICREYRIKYK